jgi:hypothetical protein
MDLFVARSRRLKSVADLTPLEREQLRIAWAGIDEEERGADEERERSFLAIVDHRNITDADGNPLYDAFTYVDLGAIFRAGTTEEIGSVVQGGVMLKEKNEALRKALQVALGPRAKSF